MMTAVANMATIVLLLLLSSSVVSVASQDICNDSCGTRGDGTFCGIDGNCHYYSCENWYRYSSTNFTIGSGGDGVDEEEEEDTSAPPRLVDLSLTCEDIPLTNPGNDDGDDDVFYASVSYRCISLNPEPISMGFNRKCTGNTLSPATSSFTCYELSETTDFGPFLAQAQISNLNCTDDLYDETGWPKFTYSVVYSTQIENGSNVVFTSAYNETIEFNETLAIGGGTMYAIYEERGEEEGEITDPPTVSPTTTTTTPAPTSAASTTAAGWYYAAMKTLSCLLVVGEIFLTN